MCGKDTQMFHFVLAFSRGVYSFSTLGPSMSKGGLCSSTLKGYQVLHWARTSISAVATSSAPAATTHAAIHIRDIVRLSLVAGEGRCRPSPSAAPGGNRRLPLPRVDSLSAQQFCNVNQRRRRAAPNAVRTRRRFSSHLEEQGTCSRHRHIAPITPRTPAAPRHHDRGS